MFYFSSCLHSLFTVYRAPSPPPPHTHCVSPPLPRFPLQVGGSDQWGNIIAGTDLIRKLMAAEGQEPPQCYGLTFPLLVRGGGGGRGGRQEHNQ